MKIANRTWFVWLCCIALVLTGCSEDISPFFEEDGDIKAGEPVMFTTYMPIKAKTRTAEGDFNDRMATFIPVAADYEFNVEMYQEGEGAAPATPTLLGDADYLPTKTGTGETATYATDGTLLVKTGEGAKAPLYWPGNAKKYGFKATAGSTTLATDQTTAEKLLLQDQLLGYGFEPLWDADKTPEAGPTDDEDNLNFRTPKEWKTANQTVLGLQQDASEYKKIPLYLKHQRSKITIILKAGEGVNREVLAFEKAQNNIETVIYSYGADVADNKIIQPLAEATTVDYTSTDFGTPEDDVATTQYTAVVEPHDYLAGASSDVIAEIKLSGQRFTFYASLDFKYGSSQDANAIDHDDAVTHMNGYNLIAGKHMIITAILGRESRKILITAYVVDWDETVTTSIVDDYGQAGDPIQINTRKQLYDFLNDPKKNKPGNVAIIVPNSLNLEQSEGTPLAWTSMPLNCTLNMAGATFRTNHPVFTTIGASGNLVNGTITVGNTTAASGSTPAVGAVVETAVAATNLGTIERINVVPKDVNGNKSSGKATVAGMVGTNSGTIVECTSELPVQGTAVAAEGVDPVYVGGIAATSVYSSENGNTMPVIDGCTVNARVDGGTGNCGGGIVGAAVGRVTDNTFEYGITLMQDPDNFKNIIQAKADETHTLRAYNNAWPTKAVNNVVVSTNINRTAEDDRYDAVIDSQTELGQLLNPLSEINHNQLGLIYRLSDDFTVTKASGWAYGMKTDIVNTSGYGVKFKLDGNNKTITTDAMLFSNIQGEIYDLTIRLGGDMIATPKAVNNQDNDVMAPLAYAVNGGTIRNIQVKGGNYRIQAQTVGGIVIWAWNNAVIEDCQCKATLTVWVNGDVSAEAKIYSGGIVANAAKATIRRCVFHNTDGTLFRNLAGTTGHTGTTENPITFDGSTIEPEATPSSGIFYGGIIGGTAPKGTSASPENPEVLIEDCTSWFNASYIVNGQPANTPQKGAIVGYSEYADGSNLENGIASGCQGNWWSTASWGIGTYKQIVGVTDHEKAVEQTIGKRNAVTPTHDSNY